MSAREQRRLRLAVAQLAVCNDADIVWIMDTMSDSQRERLTSLIESAAPMSVNDEAAPAGRLEAILATAPAFLAPRFRQAIEKSAGDGRLTESVRAVLARALHDAAAQAPAPVVRRPQAPERMGARFGRWLGMRT